MENLESKAKKGSLFISLIYVGLGTIAVLCSYPPYYGDWILLSLLIKKTFRVLRTTTACKFTLIFDKFVR